MALKNQAQVFLCSDFLAKCINCYLILQDYLVEYALLKGH